MSAFAPTAHRASDAVRIDLTAMARRGMSARQAADLRVAMLLMRSATLPDAFFDGHPAADPDTPGSLWDRVAIVAALDDVAALPELG